MVKPTDNEKYSWQNSNSIKIYSKNDCENVMNLFYERALSSNWNEQQEKKVYRVFIGRRSFVKACMYIRDHHIDEEICETVRDAAPGAEQGTFHAAGREQCTG